MSLPDMMRRRLTEDPIQLTSQEFEEFLDLIEAKKELRDKVLKAGVYCYFDNDCVVINKEKVKASDDLEGIFNAQVTGKVPAQPEPTKTVVQDAKPTINPNEHSTNSTDVVQDEDGDSVYMNLELRRRMFLEHYIKTGSATEAYIALVKANKGVDMDRSVAAVLGCKMLRKINFDDIMEQAGLTDDKITKTLTEALTATKPVTVKGELKALPDHKVRIQALELVSKLKKRLVNKVELTGKNDEPLKIVIEDHLGVTDDVKDAVTTQVLEDLGVEEL